MDRGSIRNFSTIVVTGFGFISFGLDFGDIREWWEGNFRVLFELFGILPFEQEWLNQILFWSSFLMVLTTFGVLVLVGEALARYLLDDFDLRSFFTFPRLDLIDFEIAVLVRSALLGMFIMTVFSAVVVLIAGVYPPAEYIWFFIKYALPLGASSMVFLAALLGGLGPFITNLSWGLLGATVGAILSIKNWDGLEFTPRIIALGLLGVTLGFRQVRWTLIITLLVAAAFFLFILIL